MSLYENMAALHAEPALPGLDGLDERRCIENGKAEFCDSGVFAVLR